MVIHNQPQQPIEWEIADRFCKLRLERGWSLRKAAEMIGISHVTLYNVACKTVAPPEQAQAKMLEVLREFRSWGDGHVR